METLNKEGQKTLQARPEEKVKPKLEMNLEDMRKIEDRVNQWMILEEHWTTNNLDRYQRLDHATRLFKEIKAEIQEAYKTCPAYSNV